MKMKLEIRDNVEEKKSFKIEVFNIQFSFKQSSNIDKQTKKYRIRVKPKKKVERELKKGRREKKKKRERIA